MSGVAGTRYRVNGGTEATYTTPIAVPANAMTTIEYASIDRALATNAALIGVNNRDLKSFKVDLATTERLTARFPHKETKLLVTESGIHTRTDVQRVVQAGAGAILVGESLMRHSDLNAKIQELLGG